ncbi:MAG: hypothetical protein WED12_05445 [Chloroflexota bacterium]
MNVPTTSSDFERGGPEMTGVVLPDGSAVWERLGFAVDQGRISLSGVTIELRDDDREPSLVLDPPIDRDVDGIVLGGEVTAVADVVQPNHVTAVDHVAVQTGDLDRTVEALAVQGLEPRRRAGDLRHGEGRAYAFYVLRTCVLEVVGPATPDPSRPARTTGIAFTASDLENLPVGASPPRNAVQPGRRISVLDAAGSAVRVAILTPR